MATEHIYFCQEYAQSTAHLMRYNAALHGVPEYADVYLFWSAFAHGIENGSILEVMAVGRLRMR